MFILFSNFNPFRLLLRDNMPNGLNLFRRKPTFLCILNFLFRCFGKSFSKKMSSSHYTTSLNKGKSL